MLSHNITFSIKQTKKRYVLMAVDATHPNQKAVPFTWSPVQDFVNPVNNVQQIRFSGIQPGSIIHTYNNLHGSRKRSLDTMNQFHVPSTFPATQKTNVDESRFSSFLGDDFSSQFQRQQFEIDSIISQHSKKIRLELLERQTQQAKFLSAAIQEGAKRKLREKEDQIQKMGKYNLALQERVKTLIMENQLWRDLAHTNEAQANSLRSNLEQVLAQAAENAANVDDDVESCCGSNDDVASGNRKCKGCGERESCVLLLPCRHLCLCNVCGSGSHHIEACPVCETVTNATLHVNMSP